MPKVTLGEVMRAMRATREPGALMEELERQLAKPHVQADPELFLLLGGFAVGLHQHLTECKPLPRRRNAPRARKT